MEETKSKVLEELGIYNPGEEPKVITTNSGAGKKRFFFPIFLILIVIGAVGYIGYENHQEKVIEKEAENFQQGIKYASNQIRLALFNEAYTCAIVPINNGSLELTLIATKCLTTPSPQQ